MASTTTITATNDAKLLSTNDPQSTVPASCPPPLPPSLPPASLALELNKALTTKFMRRLILIITLIENLIFSGIVFGWPALFYILKNEHIFESLCRPISSPPSPSPQLSSVTTPSTLIERWQTPRQLQNNQTYEQLDNFTSTAITTTTADELLNQTTSTMILLDCSRQENVLNQAYTIGIFAMGFTSFIWGFMLESEGLRTVRLALNFLITLGCGLLTLTTENHSHLILPAVIILGLIGVPLRIANMQIADYFPRKRSTVITVFSGAFSASPVVFVLCKYAYDHLKLSYTTVMFTLFLLSLLMLPTTLYLLPKHSVRNRERKLWSRWEQYRKALGLEGLDDERQMPPGVASAMHHSPKPRYINKSKLLKLLDTISAKENGGVGGGGGGSGINGNGTIKSCGGSMLDMFRSNSRHNAEEEDEIQCLNTNGANMNESPDTTNTANSTASVVIVSAGTSSNTMTEHRKGGILTRLMQMFHGAAAQDDIPLRVSLLSFAFLSHQLWFSWLNTYMVLYSGSLVLWLARVTTDWNEIRSFTQAFGLVQLCAIFVAPLAGCIMDFSVAKAFEETDTSKRKLCFAKSGFVPITITTASLTAAVICRFFDNSFAVYCSLVFITLLRSFLIAVASAYIRVRFPASHFSRLNGIMCTTGAFFSLLQSPLFYFENQSKEMAFYVNLFCAIMTLISWLNPLCLGITTFQRKLLEREEVHTRKLLKKVNDNNI